MNRARRRRVPAAVVALLLAAGLLGAVAPVAAHASCVGPQLVVGEWPAADPSEPSVPASVRAGATMVVSGRWFMADCYDTVSNPGGCTPASPPDSPPSTDVRLALTTAGETYDLGTADAAGADRSYEISWSVTIPAGAEPGPATLSASSAQLPVVVVR